MPGARIIIIDPQNDFTFREGVYAKRHAGIVQITTAKQKINTLLALYEREHFVILRSDYSENQFGEGVSMCIPGTFGNQIDSDLTLDNHYTVFTKTAHSALTATRFQDHLKRGGITTLFLCGFLAEYCVRQTALDALQHGYHVYLVEDCIGTGDDVQERKQAMLKELETRGAMITNSESDFTRLPFN